MQKKIFVILFSCLWLVVSGCAQDLKNQIAKLEAEKKFCQTTVDEKQAQMEKLELEVSRLSSGNEALQTLLDQKQSEINKLRDQNGQKEGSAEMLALKKQIDELKAQRDALQNEKTALSQYPAKSRKVRIKVLTGDGKMESANRMAQTVRAMGYRVERVDKAQAPRFSRHTVYYAPDFKTDAEHIVKRLGDGAVAKPLSWRSIFNIIVVTGKPS